MTALITGLRETLEAAVLIAAALAVVNRLGRRNLAQAVWYGVGAGVLVSFAVGTGLAAAGVSLVQGLGGAQIALAGLAALLLAGFVAILRCGAQGAGCEWLASLIAFLAVTPQGIELMGRAAALEGRLGLVGVLLGMAGALLLSVLLHELLLRVRLPQIVARRLAPVRQETGRR